MRPAKILETMSEFVVGVDLGQKQDYTALCVVERAELMLDDRDPRTWQCRRETRFEVRHLERMKLRTPYPAVVARIREVAMDPALGERRSLVVDATGVGAPVVDLLYAAGVGCEIVPVTITGGDGGAKASSGSSGGERRVPKRDLIVGLQVMLDLGQLQIAKGLPEAAVLLRELMGMRVRTSAAGHRSYGNGREEAHDDLVLAVALACWRAREPVRWNWFGGRPG